MPSAGTRNGGETLWIVGVGDVSPARLETAADAARSSVDGLDVRVHPDPVATTAIEIGDGEPPYNGLELARFARKQTERAYLLVVTDVPIEKPREEPAFGLAMMGGREGIVSTARLGDPASDPVEARLRTVVAQHVGYLLGMGACHDEHCLFHVADTVADLDRIGPEPCAECEGDLLGVDSPLIAGESDGTPAARDDSTATSGDAGADSPATDAPPTAQHTDAVDSVDDAPSESLHDVVNGVRFFVMLVGYGLAWLLTAFVAGRLLALATGSAVPDSMQASWVLVAGISVVAWFVYKAGRRWVVGAGRRLAGAVNQRLSGGARQR